MVSPVTPLASVAIATGVKSVGSAFRVWDSFHDGSGVLSPGVVAKREGAMLGLVAMGSLAADTATRKLLSNNNWLTRPLRNAIEHNHHWWTAAMAVGAIVFGETLARVFAYRNLKKEQVEAADTTAKLVRLNDADDNTAATGKVWSRLAFRGAEPQAMAATMDIQARHLTSLGGQADLIGPGATSKAFSAFSQLA